MSPVRSFHRLAGLVVSTLVGACTPATPPPAPVVVSADAPDPTPSPRALSRSIASTVSLVLDSSPVVCSWGSSGVIAADMPVPYWVVGTVDVTPSIALRQVELGELRLFDEQGRALGDADREWELRIAERTSDVRDFSRHGTAALPDVLLADQTQRLWFRARMEDAFASIAEAPARYSIVVRTEQGDAVLEGPVGPQWPTG